MQGIKVELKCSGRNDINSNGNEIFKEWREVEIIENEHIHNNLVSHIWYGAIFFLTLGMFRTMFFWFYYWFWTGKYRFGRLSEMEDPYL